VNKNPITNNAPVIRLNVNVLLITGTILSSLSNEVFRSRPDFITRGIVVRVIKENTGKSSEITPATIIPYAMMGMSKKIFGNMLNGNM